MVARTLAAAAAVPTEPVGFRGNLVRFHGDPVVPAEEKEQLAAVCAEVVVAAGTLRVRFADDAPGAEVHEYSDSGADSAAVAAAAAVVASTVVVAADGTMEVAPSSCCGCFVAGDMDDDLDAAVAAAAAVAADEPSFLRIGSGAAVVVVVPEVDSGLGQSLANGCFELPVVVPCFVAVDADGVAVAVADNAVAVDAADDGAAVVAADGDFQPSDSHCYS